MWQPVGAPSNASTSTASRRTGSRRSRTWRAAVRSRDPPTSDRRLAPRAQGLEQKKECPLNLTPPRRVARSEEHTFELQSLMPTSHAVFCLKTKNKYKHREQ